MRRFPVRRRWLALAAIAAATGFGAHAFAETPADGQLPPEDAPPACAARDDLLGISRIVEIDASTGPHFGDQYKDVPFLEDGEVVLTFDDGPMRRYTMPILDALDAQCTKATFFSVGRMAIADPAMLKEVAKRGHTIASHTWSHKKLKTVSAAEGEREIELGLSAVSAALGRPAAPFFRFPYLADTKAALAHLGTRGIATFGIDIDSKDFRTRNPGTVLRNVLAQLDKKRKGILLFHDIQPSTASALASLLTELKTRGIKVVHVVPKAPAATLADYDAIADKALKAKALAAAANPLAERAVTWPVTTLASGETTSAKADEVPWASGAPGGATRARKHRAPHRKPDAAVGGEHSWEIVQPFGN